MAARFAEGLNMLPQGQAERLRQLLVELNLPVALQDAVDPQAMLQAMGMDKKAQDGNLRFIFHAQGKPGDGHREQHCRANDQ